MSSRILLRQCTGIALAGRNVQPTAQVRAISNSSQITRIQRQANQYSRMYPVKVVFKDGSTITVRHQVPREIIKFPLTLEDCQTEVERKKWLARRKPKEVIEIKKDETDVRYNPMQYLKNMKVTPKKTSAGR